jgi:hypothetical protein
MVALMTIAILAVSIMGTTHVVMADQSHNSAKICIIVACDGTLNLGSGSNSNDGSTTATLIVKKVVVCNDDPLLCGDVVPADFSITVMGNNPQPPTFRGSDTTTEVTLGPGKYSVSEPDLVDTFTATFSADCSSTMNAGDTKNCTVTNTHIAS